MRQYYAEVNNYIRHIIIWAEKPIDAYRHLLEEFEENNIIQFRLASVLDVTHVKALIKKGAARMETKPAQKGKKIVGYGKTQKGKVVHAITHPMDGKTGTALCDKRTTGVEIIKKSFKPGYITCKACLSYSVLKTKIEQEKPKSAAKTPPKKEQKKKVTKPTPKQNHWKVIATEKPTLKNIIHVPTEQIMFENVPTKIARRAVFDMNSRLNVEWKSKNDPIPDGFIDKIRDAVASAYEAFGKVPEEFKPKKKESKKKEPKKKTKKQGRKITRRERPEKKKKERRVIIRRVKRKITRRIKPNGLLKMSRAGSPAHTIGECIIDKGGSTVSEIIQVLTTQHNLTEKKARSKIKGFVRKATRKLGYRLTIFQGKEPDNDRYIYGG